MRRLVVSLTVASAVVLALSSCMPAAPGPALTASPIEVPTPTPTGPPANEAALGRGPDSPIEPIDAYALCAAASATFLSNDIGRLRYAPFEESTVLLRDDGAYFVAIDVADEGAAPEAVNDSSAICGVGGTIGSPDWLLRGGTLRESVQEYIDGYNGPLGGEA